jgi:hypothetical protein
MKVHIVQLRNGKTAIFIVAGRRAYRYREGKIVAVTELPLSGIGRDWVQHTLLSDDSSIALAATKCLAQQKSRRQGREEAQQLAEKESDSRIRERNADKLRLAQLREGDFVRVSHLNNFVLAKVVKTSKVVYISKFFRKQNRWLPKTKITGTWEKISTERAAQFIEGVPWRLTSIGMPIGGR